MLRPVFAKHPGVGRPSRPVFIHGCANSDGRLRWSAGVDSRRLEQVNNAQQRERNDHDRLVDEIDQKRVLTHDAQKPGQAVARQMVDQVKAGREPGAIINMSSVNAVFAIANQVPYSVSKGGINQLTKVMSLSLASHGIRVNAIGPGSIMTQIFQSVANDKAAMDRILSRTPLGRVGDPAEIAGIALFLASADASYITGQTIYADGGRLPLNYTVPVKS